MLVPQDQSEPYVGSRYIHNPEMFISTDETGNVIRKDGYSIHGKTTKNIRGECIALCQSLAC
jgi:hypothetical protein